MTRAQTSLPPAGASSPEATGPPALDYEPAREPSLARRTLTGSAWIVGGYLALNVLRLGTNLVLVRLLTPDIFGLAAWLTTILVGLQMFSDVGIGPAIIQNSRGEEDRFLRTAWTIQVLRGWAMFLVGCALTWPLARFYGIESLYYLLPVVAFAAVIEGFRSTAFFRMNRRMRLRELTLLEMVRTTLQSILMILIAWRWPTIWALLIPMLAGIMFEAAVSHVLLRDRRDRFGWDWADARILFTFGKWIFISTLLTFVANSSDKLIFAKVFSLEELGIYYIALVLATIPTQALLKVGQKVVFPAYAQVAQSLQRRIERNFDAVKSDAAELWADQADQATSLEQESARFRSVFRRVRRVLLVLGAFAVATLVAAGPPLVQLLYPPSYGAAAWMLQILAVGAWFQILEVTNGSAMLALGQPRWVALSMAAKVIALAILIPLGIWQWGFAGAVAAVAAAELFRYAGSVIGVSRLKVGLQVLEGDLMLTAAVAVTAAVATVAGLALQDPAWSSLVTILLLVALWSPLILLTWRSHSRAP